MTRFNLSPHRKDVRILCFKYGLLIQQFCVAFLFGVSSCANYVENDQYYRVAPKKIAQSLMLHYFATFAVESRGFHSNAQKLTGKIKNGKKFLIL